MARLTFIAALAICAAVASFADRDARRPLSGRHGAPAGKTKRFIINGKDAVPHEFPWTVFLAALWKDENVYACTGSLISPRVVLTASHCVKNKTRKQKDVFDALKVGVFPGWHKNPKKTLLQKGIRKLIDVAPAYSKKFISPPLPKGPYDYRYYDYSVLILTRPLKSSKRVNFIPFANSKSLPPQVLTCYIAGFGGTGAYNTTVYDRLKNQSDYKGLRDYYLSLQPDVLQKERYKIHNKKRCDKLEKESMMKVPNVTKELADLLLWMQRRNRVKGSIICGTASRATSGIYVGDSGGPLMCRSFIRKWVLYGVTSRGAGASMDLALFANVQFISQWLKKIVAKYDPEYVSESTKVSSTAMPRSTVPSHTSVPRGDPSHGRKATIKASGPEE